MALGVHIIGSKGRMGQTLIRLAEESDDFHVVGQADVGDDLTGPMDEADAVIDFSHHSIGPQVADETARRGKVLVVGSTGHTEEERRHILEHRSSIPMIMASNYAVGVNALFYLTAKAAEILGPGYDREIVEMHHRFKKDAPSGTALTLAEAIARVDRLKLDEALRHGRSGEPGERTAGEIGMHALRGGDVVGEHTVLFAGIGERLELTIRSSSRDSYASGALRAAQWLQGKAPGAYTMFDVLGLER